MSNETDDRLAQRLATLSQMSTGMRRSEFYKRLGELSRKYQAEFDRWYDHANMPDVEHCAFIGWLMQRHAAELLE